MGIGIMVLKVIMNRALIIVIVAQNMLIVCMMGLPKVLGESSSGFLFLEDTPSPPLHMIPKSLCNGSYYDILKERISPYSEYQYICQALVLPSFEPEYSITLLQSNELMSVRDEDSAFVLTLHEAKGNIWQQEIRRKDPVPVDVKSSSRPISPDLAYKVQSTWAKAVLNSRYPKEAYLMLDGDVYYYSVFIRNFGYASGRVHDPSAGYPQAMVELTQVLYSFIGNHTIDEAVIESILTDISHQLELLDVSN